MKVPIIAYNGAFIIEPLDERYAVENAVEELKKVAMGIIESNENDGVAKWLLENAEWE